MKQVTCTYLTVISLKSTLPEKRQLMMLTKIVYAQNNSSVLSIFPKYIRPFFFADRYIP